MRPLLTGLLNIVLLLSNTLLLIGPLLLIALAKFVLPGQGARDACSRGVMWVAEFWAENCKRIFALLTPTHWDIRGNAELRRDRSYLVISNHQSWVDIPALVQAFATAREELILMGLLWTAALGVTLVHRGGTWEAVLWTVILLVQSVPYLAAVSMAAVAALPSPTKVQAASGNLPGAVPATSTAGHAVARTAAE